MTEIEPRAPAVHAKLDGAQAALAVLETEVAELALAAAENKAGAAGKLAAHREKIDLAKTRVDEMRAALRLATRIDRQTAADGVVRMRDDQLRAFKAAMSAREKAMAVVLEAAATMARAYAEFSDATLAASIATPAGTTVPSIQMGANGVLGPSFGPCERLLLAELWRLAPQRQDGIGRFVLPFAKASPLMTSTDHRQLSAGIDEFRKADEVVIGEIEKQIEQMNRAARARVEQEAA